MPGRVIVAPSATGWHGIAMTEWELTDAEWSDSHPFDEYNFVLEGELHVEPDGRVVVAGPGDTVWSLPPALGGIARPSMPGCCRSTRRIRVERARRHTAFEST